MRANCVVQKGEIGVVDMLGNVGLSDTLIDRYPHELSGGQAQRVAIARALILKPSVLICDEAVAALDGTVQADILSLLMAEQARTGLAIVFITHDLAVVRQISHRVLVMYMGRLCEISTNEMMFSRPRHPYSKALLTSVPVPDPEAGPVPVSLSGEAPSMLRPPAGCPFHPALSARNRRLFGKNCRKRCRWPAQRLPATGRRSWT